MAKCSSQTDDVPVIPFLCLSSDRRFVSGTNPFLRAHIRSVKLAKHRVEDRSETHTKQCPRHCHTACLLASPLGLHQPVDIPLGVQPEQQANRPASGGRLGAQRGRAELAAGVALGVAVIGSRKQVRELGRACNVLPQQPELRLVRGRCQRIASASESDQQRRRGHQHTGPTG